MSYNNNIPQPTDVLSQSQVQILNNFQRVQTIWETNHGDINSADGGKHKFLTMPVQAAGPIPLAGNGAVYTKTQGTRTELFYQYPSAGNPEMELSFIKAWGVIQGTTVNAGYNISSVTNAVVGEYVINFTSALSTATYSVIGSVSTTAGNVGFIGPKAGSLGINSFTMSTANTAGTLANVFQFNFVVIGY